MAFARSHLYFEVWPILALRVPAHTEQVKCSLAAVEIRSSLSQSVQPRMHTLRNVDLKFRGKNPRAECYCLSNSLHSSPQQPNIQCSCHPAHLYIPPAPSYVTSSESPPPKVQKYRISECLWSFLQKARNESMWYHIITKAISHSPSPNPPHCKKKENQVRISMLCEMRSCSSSFLYPKPVSQRYSACR